MTRKADTYAIGDIAEWLTCVVLTDAGWRCRRVDGFPYDIIARYSPTGQYLLQVKAVWTYENRRSYGTYRYPVIHLQMGRGGRGRYSVGAFDFLVGVKWDRESMFSRDPEMWMVPQSVLKSKWRLSAGKSLNRFRVTREILRARCEFDGHKERRERARR